MTLRRLILFATLLAAGQAAAILPPDASAREPQIRAYRQRLRDDYNKRQLERQAEAVRAYEKTRAEIFTPPWMRTTTGAAMTAAEPLQDQAENLAEEKSARHLLLSVVLLLAIAVVTLWVRYATREVDRNNGL